MKGECQMGRAGVGGSAALSEKGHVGRDLQTGARAHVGQGW